MDPKYDLSFFTAKDIILVPICLLLIWIVAYSARRKYNNTPIKKYFFTGLAFKLVASVIYTLVIEYYYVSGDAKTYYQGLLDMQQAVSDDISFLGDIYFNMKLEPTDRLVPYFAFDESQRFTHYYMYHTSNWLVSKTGLLFSFIFFKSYLCITFCISAFAFAGCWRIFKTFYYLYPEIHKKLAIACLFLPSVLFWGVSLLKDPLCLGALGFVLYACYNIFMRKHKVMTSIIIALVGAWFILNIKPYIILCLACSFLVWVFIAMNKYIADRTLRFFASFLLFSVSVVAVFTILKNLTIDEAAQYSTENILRTVQSQQRLYDNPEQAGINTSNFMMGTYDNSIAGFLKLFPAGVGTALFRPFLWEIRNPLMLFSALEAFSFLILTLMCFRRIGFGKTFKLIFNQPVTVFCFVFAIIFAGLVGMTTFNFGTLARYRIPCLPFYALMLFIVQHRSGKFSPQYIFSKKWF